VLDTTRCIRHSLMTNALALRMNFEIWGDKVGIADLRIMNVIICKRWSIKYVRTEGVHPNGGLLIMYVRTGNGGMKHR
jgi:hypothetical protein